MVGAGVGGVPTAVRMTPTTCVNGFWRIWAMLDAVQIELPESTKLGSDKDGRTKLRLAGIVNGSALGLVGVTGTIKRDGSTPTEDGSTIGDSTTNVVDAYTG
jgi:hypothetical protein